MSNFDSVNAPNGSISPAIDIFPLSAPASDTALDIPARGFVILTDGTVSVTTAAGEDRTFTGLSGTTITCLITHVLAATTADLLLYRK